MGQPNEEWVEIRVGKSSGKPAVVTVNCPDEIGLGCDICRVILEFGLCITRGDVSTDGKWCYVVLWVVPSSPTLTVHWPSLKERLLALCPSCPIPFYTEDQREPSQVYLLMIFSIDRKGLLHDVTKVLSQLDLLIHRVKVSTTPDGRVVDLFFISDGMELLHTNERQHDTCWKLKSVLGDSCINCELQLVDDFQQGFSSLPPAVVDQLFRLEPSDNETNSDYHSQDMTNLKKARVTIDNSLSPAHTLIQIRCIDQKGLLYDILRTLRDCNIQAEIGRHTTIERQWEVYRFLLEENRELQLANPRARSQIVDKVRSILMAR